MIVLGIDPGKDGGWAIVQGSLILAGGRSPQMKYGNKRVVTDGPALVRNILAGAEQAEKQIDEACCEMVFSRPTDGSASAFAFGLSTGAAVMASQLCAPSNGLVSPTVWKEAFNLTGGKEHKRQALDLAKTLFRWRGQPVDFNVLANDGIAEAALIARWYIERRAVEEQLAKKPLNGSQRVQQQLRKVAMKEQFELLRYSAAKHGPKQ